MGESHPIAQPEIGELTRKILNEIFATFGLPAQSLVRRVLEPVLWLPANRFSRLGAGFDQVVARSGINEGARWALPQLVDSTQVSGAERVPAEGPLVIASNHPGTYDSLAICACLERKDIKILVSGVPFTHSLPASREYLIYVTSDVHTRTAALRASIAHLRSGGALLIFPRGTYEPDPVLMSGGRESIARWSPSLELFLRKVPETQVILAIASGVLAESCLRHPFVRLAGKGRNPQKLAEFVQITQQMIFGVRYPLLPRVTFGEPFHPARMVKDAPENGYLELVIRKAQALFDTHLEQI